MHSESNIIYKKPKTENSEYGLIMVHGRGDGSNKMELLAHELDPEGKTYQVFPKADNASWYPMSFLAPREQNEPYFSAALNQINAAISKLVNEGYSKEKIIILGFSQGACLSIDVATRDAQKFAQIFVLSGGLIGPSVNPDNYHGDFQGTSIFMGCSDIDSHIPLQRLYESKEQLLQMGAVVELRVYENGEHTINDDEMSYLKNYFNHILN